jgi:thiamine-monophosphate kinase
MRNRKILEEFKLIRMITAQLGIPSRRVLTGIGDDTAVLKFGAGKLLATIDMQVEGIHFDLNYCLPAEIGHKALAVNLSDIAAMGGSPRYALVSLALPERIDETFIKSLYRGMKLLSRRFDVDIVGGNLTRTPGPLVIDIACLGETKKPRLRKGARPGDFLAVTGNLGNSAAGLAALREFGRSAVRRFPTCARAHLLPTPRVKEGLRFKSATSMIDISDGLSSEAHHLAEHSGVGLIIDERLLPIGKECREIARRMKCDPLVWALHGGEDYELLFTGRGALPSGAKVIGGVIPRNDGVQLQRMSGESVALSPKGWNHFS